MCELMFPQPIFSFLIDLCYMRRLWEGRTPCVTLSNMELRQSDLSVRRQLRARLGDERMVGGWTSVKRVKARALKEESNHGKEEVLSLRDSRRGP